MIDILKQVLSRKLLGALAGISGNVGVVLGIAVIDPTLLESAKEIIGIALVSITALGGYQVAKQGEIDRVAVAANGSPDRS